MLKNEGCRSKNFVQPAPKNATAIAHQVRALSMACLASVVREDTKGFRNILLDLEPCWRGFGFGVSGVGFRV